MQAYIIHYNVYKSEHWGLVQGVQAYIIRQHNMYQYIGDCWDVHACIRHNKVYKKHRGLVREVQTYTRHLLCIQGAVTR